MNSQGGSLLSDLKWVVRNSATGQLELSDIDGHCVPGAVEAPELFSDGGTGEGEVRFTSATGATTLLAARRVPGVAGLAVALAGDAAERAAGPLVESLVNQIAHDVRNYAFTIALQAELGERRAGASPEVRDHFVAVLRQIDALKSFLEKLLLFGRPVTLRPATIAVADLVRQQVQAAQFAWRGDTAPLAITVDVAAEVGGVRWDANAVGAALAALLDNAARSADPAPPIGVLVTREGSTITIQISDHGKGIPADKLAQLGTPMRVRRHGGAGLGLAIARKMIAAHGGTLAIATGPDGTTVRMSLPAEVGAG